MIRFKLETIYNPFENRNQYYLDTDGLKLGRIAGGMAWPTLSDPGYAVIVGEMHIRDEVAGIKHLHLITEHQDESIKDLLQWCEMNDIHVPSEVRLRWYADTNNRPNMSFVSERKREMKEKGQFKTSSFVMAPFLDHKDRDDYLIHSIGKYLFGAEKTLHMSEDSPMRQYISSIQDKASIPVLALGYAVSALSTWPNAGRIS